MARKENTAKSARPRSSLLTKLLVVVLLAAIGWQLYDLRDQVLSAQSEKAQYAAQVQQIEQENAALKNDIADGTTTEKVEEIARNELCLVRPDEYVFYPVN
jgi:cell division protein FtsB